jgi:ADP-ribose pyrophosphatase YjhB (NUDIX family)
LESPFGGDAVEPKWLDWAKRLQAIAQNGLTYARDHYDVERYRQVQQITAEMLTTASGQDIDRITGLFDQQVGYATPKVDVRGVVFRDGRILLVKEAADLRWTLPGGWADPYESPREAVEREVCEESGFQTHAVKLLAVYDRSKHAHEPPFAFHVYKLFILCHIVGGEPTGSVETAAVGFFEEGSLPELSVSRVTKRQIHRLFEHGRNLELPTDFD